MKFALMALIVFLAIGFVACPVMAGDCDGGSCPIPPDGDDDDHGGCGGCGGH